MTVARVEAPEPMLQEIIMSPRSADILVNLWRWEQISYFVIPNPLTKKKRNFLPWVKLTNQQKQNNKHIRGA